jgi:hypothetical protein
VYGTDTSGSGGYGVSGISERGIGVYGTLSSGRSGLIGQSNVSAVVGDTSNGTGVAGLSSGGNGVYGSSSNDDGVVGQTSADHQSGVLGNNVSTGGTGIGVFGVSQTGTGIVGLTFSATECGVASSNNGGGPTLSLGPSAATLPATCSPGEFIVLTDGSLHYCETLNEWITLGSGGSSPSVVTIDPVRVINTTTGEGGITGPLVAGSTVHTSSVIPGTNGIPANATAILGNFAISGVGGALLNGYGTATIFPAGIATPATANINAGAGCFAISNAVSVGVGTGGSAGKLSVVWDGGGPVPNAEAFLDVTGYII